MNWTLPISRWNSDAEQYANDIFGEHASWHKAQIEESRAEWLNACPSRRIRWEDVSVYVSEWRERRFAELRAIYPHVGF